MKTKSDRARELLTLTPDMEFILGQDGFVGALYAPQNDGYPGKR